MSSFRDTCGYIHDGDDYYHKHWCHSHACLKLKKFNFKELYDFMLDFDYGCESDNETRARLKEWEKSQTESGINMGFCILEEKEDKKVSEDTNIASYLNVFNVYGKLYWGLTFERV